MRLKQLNSELGYSNLTGNLTEIQREEKCKTLVGTRIEISTSISNIRESDISLENESWSHMSLIQDSYDRDQLSIRLHFDKEKFGSQMLELNRQDGVEVTAKITSFTGTYPTYCELELISVAKVNDISKRINAEQEAKRKAAKTQSVNALLPLLVMEIMMHQKCWFCDNSEMINFSKLFSANCS